MIQIKAGLTAAALCTSLFATTGLAATATTPRGFVQVRSICDADGRCDDTGPRFRDREDDDMARPRRRFDPDDDDRPPPPRHRRYDPDDDDDRPPPPPRHRRYDPDDDR